MSSPRSDLQPGGATARHRCNFSCARVSYLHMRSISDENRFVALLLAARCVSQRRLAARQRLSASPARASEQPNFDLCTRKAVPHIEKPKTRWPRTRLGDSCGVSARARAQGSWCASITASLPIPFQTTSEQACSAVASKYRQQSLRFCTTASATALPALTHHRF